MVMPHRGVALNDDRNRGVLELLRPEQLTTAIVTARLIRAYRGKPPADLAAQVARIMSRPSGADVPASQPLSAVADPLYGLGTHPDLIERLWTLNAALPQDCRWVVFGFPALVTPAGGVVFAFAQGTLGYALRVTEEYRSEADNLGLKTRTGPGDSGLDVSVAGSEWRLGRWLEREAAWCRSAYEAFGKAD
jgi:hypothetical protein